VFCEMKVLAGDDDVAWPKHVDSVIKTNVFRFMLCCSDCIFFLSLRSAIRIISILSADWMAN
jgi:hypothetical protein